MSVKALQDYTYISKYARYSKDNNRRETWPEAVDRVKQMHLRKHPHAKDEIEWAFEQVLQQRVLGSQRALQFGGTPIEKVNARIYNCSFAYCDRPRFFQEAFYLLLAGSGVGFSVQKKHVGKMPNIHRPEKGSIVYQIPDSIEGWADSLGVLVSSYMEDGPFPEYFGHDVEFDFSLIRKKGSSISSGSGKAPGPEPLKAALDNIRKLFDRQLDAGADRLRPIDAYDVVMYSADAVLSGGVRRSATIALFSPDDMEMAKAKTGNWFYENPQRARSNNSALLVRNKTTREQFKMLMDCVKEFGEPGFVWADDEDCGFNPCVEINLYAYDEFGNSGWQFCNLCEINGKMLTSEEDFAIAAKAGAIIGTLQASYTDFPYLGEVSERITRREALLGVSITGMMENPHIVFDPEIQKRMALLIKEVNGEFAAKIGVNPAARCTCVKPAGTTSCILGTSSGIHPHHSRRYFRRTQANEMEAPFLHFSALNPKATEKSVWRQGDGVLTFCIEVGEHAKTKQEVGALDLLEYVKLTQQNWVEYGTRYERCAQPWLRHNVSNTINVKPTEWDTVEDYIYNNRSFFAGISLLPHSGDLDYPQAPFCSISTPSEIVQKYGDGSVMVSGLIVDGLHAFDDLWRACDAVLGRFSDLNSVQEDWVRRAKQFAERYFNSDIQQMLYALKEVNNWKHWCDLRREFKDVDYSLLKEYTDETNLVQEAACAGGQCEVKFN